jgi:hypothetical protein
MFHSCIQSKKKVSAYLIFSLLLPSIFHSSDSSFYEIGKYLQFWDLNVENILFTGNFQLFGRGQQINHSCLPPPAKNLHTLVNWA